MEWLWSPWFYGVEQAAQVKTYPLANLGVGGGYWA